MTPTETRILPLPTLKDAHAFVSMPPVAWFWLDDLVKTRYSKGGYKALINAFADKAACPETLSAALRGKAQAHLEEQMAAHYNLSNDNNGGERRGLKLVPALPGQPGYSRNHMPFAYQLFKFLAHPTHLSTVWERRHYTSGWNEPGDSA